MAGQSCCASPNLVLLSAIAAFCSTSWQQQHSTMTVMSSANRALTPYVKVLDCICKEYIAKSYQKHVLLHALKQTHMLQARRALFPKGPVLSVMVCHSCLMHVFVAVVTLHIVAANPLASTPLRSPSPCSCFSTPQRLLCSIICRYTGLVSCQRYSAEPSGAF